MMDGKTQEDQYRNLFPALYKLNEIEEVIRDFRDAMDGAHYTRREQNVYGAEVTDRIRKILG